MGVVNPKSVKVNITTGTGVDIDWDDGHRTHFAFQWLRDACPCATCTEERNNHNRKPGEPVKQASSLLPMYKEPVKPKEVKSVGRYAVNFSWNDGHASGIYSWDYLREMCQCEECRKSGDRASSGQFALHIWHRNPVPSGARLSACFSEFIAEIPWRSMKDRVFRSPD